MVSVWAEVASRPPAGRAGPLHVRGAPGKGGSRGGRRARSRGLRAASLAASRRVRRGFGGEASGSSSSSGLGLEPPSGDWPRPFPGPRRPAPLPWARDPGAVGDVASLPARALPGRGALAAAERGPGGPADRGRSAAAPQPPAAPRSAAAPQPPAAPQRPAAPRHSWTPTDRGQRSLVLVSGLWVTPTAKRTRVGWGERALFCVCGRSAEPEHSRRFQRHLGLGRRERGASGARRS